MRIIALGPSSSGKSNMLVTLLTDQRFYKHKFEKIYWCSPTSSVDPSLDVLRKYGKTELGNERKELLDGMKKMMDLFQESRTFRTMKE